MSSNNDEKLNQLIERDKRAKKILFIGYIVINIFMLLVGAYSLFTFIELIDHTFAIRSISRPCFISYIRTQHGPSFRDTRIRSYKR